MTKIRVLLADDHAVLRAGLKMLIHSQPDMEVCGEAADFSQVAPQLREHQPDVLSLDLAMPGGPGIPVIEQVRREFPRTRVLVLTMHDDPTFLRAALAAGASGYVVKKAADTDLLAAIRAVHAGESYVSAENETLPTAAAKADTGEQRAPADTLSPREREVLVSVAQGHTNQAIADRLALSVKTVETYRARLMTKLGLSSRAELIRYALERGLIRPGVMAPTDG